MQLARMIDLARGSGRVDLVIRNCRVVNVLSGEIHQADVGIADGFFLGFGAYKGKHEYDAKGRFLLPGLVEGHIHIESTLLTPPGFARAVAEHGTAAVVCDPHEIANVLGRTGVEYMLKTSRYLPVSIFFMFPSCVPATALEDSGARLNSVDVEHFLRLYPDRILGLAEMMNFPGVLAGDEVVLSKLKAAAGKVIDGHAPLLSGMDLNGYVLAGPRSDHECSNISEALEKMRAGMHLMMREGSLERNMEDLLGVVNDFNSQNISIVTDDRNVLDLRENGHLDYGLRRAVALGMDPIRAVQMVSINPARYFGLNGYGAIGPGFKANCFLVDDLKDFTIHDVFLSGLQLDEHDFESGNGLPVRSSMNIGAEINESMFEPEKGSGKIRVIGTSHGQLLTENLVMEPLLEDGIPIADPARDICKLTVIERHRATGHYATGFVRGLGITDGAIAGTVAHDSHNLIVAGMNDADMVLAAQEVVRMGGGFVVVREGSIVATLPLPIAGLMSDKGLVEVADGVRELNRATQKLGCSYNPFMLISFLALPVIPSLKLTDRGLVDVDAFDFTGLWTD
ncbi:adenine deaminase [Maridesulfovibrio salexigens]|uniref:Adenine deaminase n=1 Tax=Maridesulfovibrio salexigens (strain ATCC 14822 / DSM 2638 / NCIMB 8403 / VKM B-1763) TaxID=526222 RepID=C6BXM5_MARSD|nr:adenine deaminase [Maridesulfovibrio salexigens]ACS78583.1 adenine deaminase [Maridesulfovibrio salexigens DSM 2638]